tara:strand:- start:554 stop:1048 length:495 start_codon:yes stop_codon:yes gene_type:complete
MNNENTPIVPTHKDLLIQLLDAPFTWPGGYPKYGVTDDNHAICSGCAKDEFDRLYEAEAHDGFYISMLTVNWEDENLYCDHCGDAIESAYGGASEEEKIAGVKRMAEQLAEQYGAPKEEVRETPNSTLVTRIAELEGNLAISKMMLTLADARINKLVKDKEMSR